MGRKQKSKNKPNKRNLMKSFQSRGPEKIVQDIRQGKHATTAALSMCGDSERDRDRCFSTRLVNAGVMDTLFGFLDKCSDCSFEEVKNGGDVSSPALWIEALGAVLYPEDLEQPVLVAARRIGPLSECMVDPERKLYLTREHWIDSVVAYVSLLHRLVRCEAAMQVLLQQQAVVDFLTQCLFFEQYRSDIWKELNNFAKSESGVTVSIQVMKTLVEEAVLEICSPPDFPLTDAEKDHVRRMAATLAVCPSYAGLTDESLHVTLLSGVLGLLKVGVEDGVEEPRFGHLVAILHVMSFGDCISIGALEDIVQIAYHATSRDSAVNLLGTLRSLSVGFEEVPNDVSFALAVGAGLLELCVHVLTVFGDSFHLPTIEAILQSAGLLALSPRTGKALQDRGASIREAVEKFEQLNLPNVCEKARYLEALVEKALLVEHGVVEAFDCRWCRRVLQPDGMQFCGGCKQTFYCNASCQKRDWKEGGHKRDCKILKPQARGARVDEIKSMNRMRENCRVVAETCFISGLDELKEQAAAGGCDLADCVVAIGLDATPIFFEARRASVMMKHLEHKRTDPEFLEYAQLVVEQNQQKGALTLFFKRTLTVGPQMGKVVIDLFAFDLDDESSDEESGSSEDSSSSQSE